MPKGNTTRWNFRVLLGQGVLLDVSQTLSSPRLVLPFLYISFGAPAIFAGLLIPIVQISRMIGQIVSAPFISAAEICKWYMSLGILTASTALVVIALTADTAEDARQFVILTAIFLGVAAIIGLGQGLSRLAFQNMLGYVVPRKLRRNLLFSQTGLSGLLAIILAWASQKLYFNEADEEHLALLWVGIAVAIFSGILSMLIRESAVAEKKQRGANSGDRQGILATLRAGINHVRQVEWFRQFVIARILFLSIELAMPFYAIIAAQEHEKTEDALGGFVIATSLGLMIGGFFWQRLSPWPLRRIMSLGGIFALAAAVIALLSHYGNPKSHWFYYDMVFFLIALADQGIASTRKIYVATLASAETRPYYIAVSDTLVGGVAVLFAFALGILAHFQHSLWPILVLAGLNGLAALYAMRLKPIPADAN
ncbi:MAG: hypothetical protein CBB70_06340 [Planctomycetaceae bacterium TMED10]|nr:MAG: hypothetical protein CBB70_12770 [Planctomycetaceae bacterium TMED10]OUT68503.1 MAG: hypothetical protein CBB70_06340 [Planctomycetaceae bacterium TMED10]